MIENHTDRRILIVHRYFHPDTPTYAKLLKKLSEYYKSEFQSVSVLTAFPSYYGSKRGNVPARENMNGVEVRRLKLFKEKNRNFGIRMFNSLIFAAKIFVHIVYHGKKKYDIIQVATTPPILVSGAVSLACGIRALKYIYHCQDIYPEIVNLTEIRNKYFTRFLFVIDRLIMKSADKIVVLSVDMKKYLIKGRGILSHKIAVINNFNFTDKFTNTDFHEPPEDIKTFCSSYEHIVLFAGNIGLYQDLGVVCEAIESLQQKISVGFLIIGEGVEKKRLVNKYGSNEGILFTRFLDQKIVEKVYHLCSVGVAPVVRGIEKVAFPSKIISYCINGIPVISFSTRNSEISKLIESNNWGQNYSFENELSLENVIFNTLSRQYDRKAISDEANRIFGEQEAFERWKNIILEL